LNLIYERLGFPFCIIAGFDQKTSESDIISFVQNGKPLKTIPTEWEQIISKEISISDKTDNLLIIVDNILNDYPGYEFLSEFDISSSMSIDILDKNNCKIGLLVIFDSKPIVQKPLYKKLFKILGDWIGKELHRFKYESALEETNFMHDAVLNGTTYAIFAVNHNFEIILINNNTLPVFNLKEKKKLMETRLIKGNERYTLAEIVTDFSQSNKETDYFLLENGNNDFKELKISFTRIQLAGKNRLSYVIFVDDITDRTLSEKKLIASEQLFRSIAENFPKGTIDVLDKSFNYIYSDGEEYRQTGVDPRKLIGTHHLDIYSGENYKITKHHLDKILKGETVSYEISTGNQKFLKSGVPLTNNLGEIDRVLLVKQNITEANKLESEREKLIKDLKSHNEELLRFAYIVSHNLRAPIVNISLLLDLFNENQPDDPENKEVIENLKISTNLLDTTLQDLIEVVSIKKQKIPKVDLIDFKLLLNNVEKSLYNQLKESGITIHKDFSRLEEMNYVYAHMENFFLNFMTNSVKYKHPDRAPEVWVSTYQEKNYCVIRFEDNGIGLDLERYGDRLFGLYQRFHNHVEGKGLGLYLVREQIRVNDGKIEVESTVGKGTLFKIYLRNLIPTNNKRMPEPN
jgi:signal transduction histidine kinase